jgi:hypothetical protein
MTRLLPALAAALWVVAALPGLADTVELGFATDRYMAGSDIEIETPTEGTCSPPARTCRCRSPWRERRIWPRGGW